MPPTTSAATLACGVAELGERLSDRLETRVKVDVGRKRGKLTIEFATLDDLHRIVGLIDPGAADGGAQLGSVPEQASAPADEQPEG